MSIDLRDLRQVAALGQHRSFARAAQALGISQPALSKAIRHLEDDLGVRLFLRGARGVVPTVAGQLLLSRAEPLLRGVGDIVQEVQRLKGLGGGSLTVGAAFFPHAISAGPALCRLARRWPGLHLRMRQGDWRILTREVVAGSLDIAVAELAAARREPSLHVEPLGAHGGAFFCRSGHPLAGRSPLTLRDLAPFPLAMAPVPDRLAPIIVKAGFAGRVDPATGDFTFTLTVDSLGLMKDAVGGSDAIGWAPTFLLAADVAAGRVVLLEVDAAWARLDYGVIRLRDRVPTPAEEAFVAELRAVEAEVISEGAHR